MSPNPSLWQPHDIIVLILASILLIAAIMTYTQSMIRNQPIDGERAKNIAAVLMAIVAIISLYIGAKMD